jgi:hypothetical protein
MMIACWLTTRSTNSSTINHKCKPYIALYCLVVFCHSFKIFANKYKFNPLKYFDITSPPMKHTITSAHIFWVRTSFLNKICSFYVLYTVTIKRPSCFSFPSKICITKGGKVRCQYRNIFPATHNYLHSPMPESLPALE